MYSTVIKKQTPNREYNNKDKARKPSRPGDTISVDQMVSPTPGLIAKMTGFVTTQRYKYATIFVDQYSKRTFVWLQRSPRKAETLEGKVAFEKEAENLGIHIQHYHADNGIFKAHGWVRDCFDKHQKVKYAGVNSHHQNGIAKIRIRWLQNLV